MQPVANDRRRELASFLRSRRERVSPAEMGLPAARRRVDEGMSADLTLLTADLAVAATIVRGQVAWTRTDAAG